MVVLGRVTPENFTWADCLGDLGMEDVLRWSDFARFTDSGVPNSFPDWIGEQLLGEIVNELEWFSTVGFDPRVHSGERRARVMYYQGVLFQPTQWLERWMFLIGSATRGPVRGWSGTATWSERRSRSANRAVALRPTLYGLTWPLRDVSFERKQAVVEGLRRTRWGQDLAEELIKEFERGR